MIPAARLERQRRRVARYLAGGQVAAAQAALEALLRQAPGDWNAGLQLGEALRARGFLRAAVRQWLPLAGRLPHDARAIAQLATHLYFNGESVAARACFEHPEVARTRDPVALAELALAQQPLDEPAITLALLERALQHGADSLEVHFTHAQMLAFTGQADAAEARLQAICQRWPTFGGGRLTLLQLRRQTDAGQLALLEDTLARLPTNHIAHAEFQFARFKLLDDLGRHEEAWTALAAGNATMHALNPYDAGAERAFVDTIIAQSLRTAAATADAAASDAGAQPIFIVGLPRSGTTLLERMLSNHSAIASAGELKDMVHRMRFAVDLPGRGLEALPAMMARAGGIDSADLGRRYLQQTRWRAHGARYYVDKLPNNHLFVHWICQALPGATIVHIRRTPMDVCFSNFKAMFGHTSPWCYDQQALAAHHRQYRRLMAHWRNLWPGRMVEIDYADLVTQPADTLASITTHLGLAPESACTRPAHNPAPVSTPSASQVREPLHTRALGAWQAYAQQLAPLRAALDGPTLES